MYVSWKPRSCVVNLQLTARSCAKNTDRRANVVNWQRFKQNCWAIGSRMAAMGNERGEVHEESDGADLSAAINGIVGSQTVKSAADCQPIYND